MLHSDKVEATCFRKVGEFVTRSIAGEAIVVPVRGQVGDLNSIYNLNEVGTFIWERIDGRATVGQIREAICAEFEVTREEALEDTLQFMNALKTAGILVAEGHED
jgi:hypothetical protein